MKIVEPAQYGSRFQGIDKSSTAYKLLASMGWQEGQGLGAQKQGITSHVKVKKKADASGVGLVQEATKSRDWTLGMAAYDRVLASLKVVTAAEPVVIEPDGAAEKSVSKKRRASSGSQIKKAKRLKSGGKSLPKAEGGELGAVDTPQTASLTDEGPREETGGVKATRVLAATHVGRFKKAVRGKAVKSYSVTDLAAILGGQGDDRAADFETLKRKTDPSTTSSQDPARLQEPPDERSTPGPGAEGGSAPVMSNVWWAGHFIQAGRSGACQSETCMTNDKGIAVHGFSEADQANLWQNVTDAQSKSHRGLGRGSAAGGVGGVLWTGTKTRITDSDDENGTEAAAQEAAAEAQPSDPETAGGEAEGIVIVPSRRAQEQQAAGEEVIDVQGSQPHVKPLKYKKLAKVILGGQGGSMRLKPFKALAWSHASAKGATRRRKTLDAILDVLSSSSQFVIGPDTVSLRP